MRAPAGRAVAQRHALGDGLPRPYAPHAHRTLVPRGGEIHSVGFALDFPGADDANRRRGGAFLRPAQVSESDSDGYGHGDDEEAYTQSISRSTKATFLSLCFYVLSEVMRILQV